MGIVAGAHIAFGAYLAVTVGGACPGIAAENPGLQKVRLCLVVFFAGLNALLGTWFFVIFGFSYYDYEYLADIHNVCTFVFKIFV